MGISCFSYNKSDYWWTRRVPKRCRRESYVSYWSTGSCTRSPSENPCHGISGHRRLNMCWKKIHEGCHESHVGGRVLARIVLLVGYYWPTLEWDANHWVVTLLVARSTRFSSTGCQADDNGDNFMPLWSMRNLYRGTFPPGPAQKRFLLALVNYFSKWIETELLTHIMGEAVMKFLQKNIICHFWVYMRLVSDDGRQFQGKRIWEWCKELKIQQMFTSIAYTQSIRHVEAVNPDIVRVLRVKLDHVSGSWVDEGWIRCLVSYGHIGQPPKRQWEKHHSV